MADRESLEAVLDTWDAAVRREIRRRAARLAEIRDPVALAAALSDLYGVPTAAAMATLERVLAARPRRVEQERPAALGRAAARWRREGRTP